MPLKQSAMNFDFMPGENLDEKNNASPETKSVSSEISEVQETDIVIESFAKNPEMRRTRSADPDFSAGKKSTRGRMRLSDMNASAGLIDVPDDEVLFEKSYYSIGVVSEMFKVNQSLIRFWENEFNILKPKKNAKGDRFFRPEDVKNLKLIYHLLRERKYTIEGAREFLKNNKNADKKFEMISALKNLKNFLNELKANL